MVRGAFAFAVDRPGSRIRAAQEFMKSIANRKTGSFSSWRGIYRQSAANQASRAMKSAKNHTDGRKNNTSRPHRKGLDKFFRMCLMKHT
jgi:3-deoxy-D-arabino-heptulosonate 7-phosphate (DAHP) synthase